MLRKDSENEKLVAYVANPSEPNHTAILSVSSLRNKLVRKKFFWVDKSFEGEQPPEAKFYENLALVNCGKQTGHGVIAKRVFEKGEIVCYVPGKISPENTEFGPYCFRLHNAKGKLVTIDAEVYGGFGSFIKAGPTEEFLAEIQIEASEAIATVNVTVPKEIKGIHALVATRRIEENEMLILDYLAAFYEVVIKDGGLPSLFKKIGGEIIPPHCYRVNKPALLFCTREDNKISAARTLENKNEYDNYALADGKRRLIKITDKKLFPAFLYDVYTSFDCKIKYRPNPSQFWLVIEKENNFVFPKPDNLSGAILLTLLYELHEFSASGQNEAVERILETYKKYNRELLHTNLNNHTTLSHAVVGKPTLPGPHDSVIKILLDANAYPYFEVREEKESETLVEIYIRKLFEKNILQNDIQIIDLNNEAQQRRYGMLIPMLCVAQQYPKTFETLTHIINRKFNLKIIPKVIPKKTCWEFFIPTAVATTTALAYLAISRAYS